MRHMLALKYIDMVAKSGSIRSASEMLAITPSALNRRILAIEEELGIEIFERHAAGVRLNSAGELFIQHIRSQMADLERVRSRIADLSGVRMGRVRIAVTQEIGVGLLPKLIQNYRAEFPGVTFSITTCQRNELERRLQNLEADIAVAFQPANLADVHTLLHRAQPLHIVVASAHPLAKRKEVRLVDCLEEGALLPRRGDGIRELVEAAAVRKGLDCSPMVEAEDHHYLREITRSGGGVMFSCPLIDGEQPMDGLKSVPLVSGEIENGFLFVCQLRNRTLPVAVGKFVDELRKSIGD